MSDDEANNSAAALKLAVVHWSPVELYPPVLNLLRRLLAIGSGEVTVHTTRDHLGQPVFAAAGLRVHRTFSPTGHGAFARAFAYAWFQVATLVQLLLQRPQAILYVEPSSAFPVWLHSWLRPRIPVFIHHHEYHSPDQFLRSGMRLIRWFHRLERRRLLPRAAWVSHTNARRMELFQADCPEVPEAVCRILPNCPPASWQGTVNTAWAAGIRPFRFVYAGSLSLRDTFIAEFARWLATLPQGTATLDVYAYNLDAETAAFLEAPATAQAGVRWIRGGIPYDELPDRLRHYHAGLILYRAQTLNYRFNETNKLFEYLACGLDVWYADTMEGVRPHARADTTPRVIPIDFACLAADSSPAGLSARTAAAPHPAASATAEAALAPLIAALAACGT